MELNAINPWLVRPANELKFSVPVCSSLVKRVLTRSDCADLDANDDFVLLRRCLPDPMWSVLPHVVMVILVASTSRCSHDGRVRHVEATNKAKAVLAGADPNFKVASLRRCLINVFCPVVIIRDAYRCE